MTLPAQQGNRSVWIIKHEGEGCSVAVYGTEKRALDAFMAALPDYNAAPPTRRDVRKQLRAASFYVVLSDDSGGAYSITIAKRAVL